MDDDGEQLAGAAAGPDGADILVGGVGDDYFYGGNWGWVIFGGLKC